MKKTINKFYVGAEHIARAIEAGTNDSHTCATLDEAIAEAKGTLEEYPNRQSVIIVQIVRIVRRKNIPVEIQVVK